MAKRIFGIIFILVLSIGCERNREPITASGFIVRYKESYNIRFNECYDFWIAVDCDSKTSFGKTVDMNIKTMAFHYCSTGNDNTASWGETIKEAMQNNKTCKVKYMDTRTLLQKKLFDKSRYTPIQITIN